MGKYLILFNTIFFYVMGVDCNAVSHAIVQCTWNFTSKDALSSNQILTQQEFQTCMGEKCKLIYFSLQFLFAD